MESFSYNQIKYFFLILQFLSFIKNLEYSKHSLPDFVFYSAKFPLTDFLKFIKVKPNQYQREKFVEMLGELQIQKIQAVYEKGFLSTFLFPAFSVKKIGRSWMVTLTISEYLYLSFHSNYYYFPKTSYCYCFPEQFLSSEPKCDFLVRLVLISSISTYSLTKRVDVEEFLNQFCVGGTDTKVVKEKLINGVKIIKKTRLIKDECTIIKKNGQKESIQIKNLTPLIIGKIKFLEFQENL